MPPGRPWLVLPGLFAVGAAARALRFAAPFHWPCHWDETQLATPALQVLAGGLPPNGGVEYDYSRTEPDPTELVSPRD
jgi:hypothetical protein